MATCFILTKGISCPNGLCLPFQLHQLLNSCQSPKRYLSTLQFIVKAHPLVEMLKPHILSNEKKYGGGIVLFLGVPNSEVEQQVWITLCLCSLRRMKKLTIWDLLLHITNCFNLTRNPLATETTCLYQYPLQMMKTVLQRWLLLPNNSIALGLPGCDHFNAL